MIRFRALFPVRARHILDVMVGNLEVILGLSLFGGQVVNALLFCVGLSEPDPPPGPLHD